MRIFVVLFVILNLKVLTAELKVLSPCSKKILIEKELKIQNNDVNSFTQDILQKMGIKFKANAGGIESILETPTGLDAYEVVSDQEMFAYGWCYSVNGQSPELLASQFEINDNDTVTWWFAYAHYHSGEWISQCSDSVERKEEAFCKKINLNN